MACVNGRHGKVARRTKGSLGQSLVREYFEYAGWAVVRSGLETVADHVMEKVVDAGDFVSLPDLLVSKISGSEKNPASHRLGQAFYVEVKTLKSWPRSPAQQEFSRYLKWGHVLVVWVSPRGLRGAWVSRPGDRQVDKVVLQESDFKPLAQVGVVSLRHCDDKACQERTRRHFDQLGAIIAGLPAGAGH